MENPAAGIEPSSAVGAGADTGDARGCAGEIQAIARP